MMGVVLPLFMDAHNTLPEGATAADVAEAHRKDLEVQDKYNVKNLNYWVDDNQAKVFCLSEAPDAGTAVAVYREAYGLLPDEIFQVQQGGSLRNTGTASRGPEVAGKRVLGEGCAGARLPSGPLHFRAVFAPHARKVSARKASVRGTGGTRSSGLRAGRPGSGFCRPPRIRERPTLFELERRQLGYLIQITTNARHRVKRPTCGSRTLVKLALEEDLLPIRRPHRRERLRAVRRVRQLAEIVTVRLYNKHLNPLAVACERDEVPPGRPLSGDRPYRQRRGSVQAGPVRVHNEKPCLADGRKERREHHSGSVR